MEVAPIAARLSKFCILAHGLIFGLLHITEPQLIPTSSIISDYLTTDSAWLALLSFYLFAAVWVSASFVLSGAPKSRLILFGRLLFVMAFIAIMIATVFPTSMDPRTGTLLSKIMNLLARPGLFLGVLLVSMGLHRKADWKPQASLLLALSVCLIILLVFTINFLLPRELGGIGQRLIFLLLYVWVWIVASGVLKSTR